MNAYVKFLAAVLAAGLLAPATASADRADCEAKLERTYSAHYYAAAKQLGKRAPGRNIRKFGVRYRGGDGDWRVRDAHCKDLRKSRGQLVRLRRPAPRFLVRQAAPPSQAPSGALSPSVGAGGTLGAIAACESGGNPSAVSPNGMYRGKYQFDQRTWESVGGSGDPAAASEAEQDRRAAALYAQRGAQPWPVCGR